jgi:hypothetical protein
MCQILLLTVCYRSGDVTMHKLETCPKNDFLKDLENEDEVHYSTELIVTHQYQLSL